MNSKYAAAAKAAGIGMGGGLPKDANAADCRDKFIASLAGLGLTTQETADIINVTNYVADEEGKILEGTLSTTDTQGNEIPKFNGIKNAPFTEVPYNKDAGMGGEPLVKGEVGVVSLADLVASEDIGKQKIDWLKMYSNGQTITQIEYERIMKVYNDNLDIAKRDWLNEDPTRTYIEMNKTVENLLKSKSGGLLSKFRDLEDQIDNAKNDADRTKCKQELEKLKNENSENKLGWALYQKDKMEELYKNNYLTWESITTEERAALLAAAKEYDPDGTLLQKYEELLKLSKADIGPSDSWLGSSQMQEAIREAVKEQLNQLISEHPELVALYENINNYKTMEDYFQTSGSYIEDSSTGLEPQITIVKNGAVESNEGKLKNMTIGDLLKNDIVMVVHDSDLDAINSMANKQYSNVVEYVSEKAGILMDAIAEIFGCGKPGVGLNVDDQANNALNMALAMVKKNILRTSNAVGISTKFSEHPTEDCAYINAENYNRIGTDDDNKDEAAINLSNMLSAFLTYFDNVLNGAESDYVVGKSNDEGDTYSKTQFVTDDSSYKYIISATGGATETEMIADFYDQLFNNILEHGYRIDDSVDDHEYLESVIKDGRYQLAALYPDGYYYQSRYNDINYLVEETDKNAIARAEAEYTQKKAELTYKEDQIDAKSKTLDAEIAELTTEMESVKNIIAKSIEKTFTMFQN